MKKRKEIRIIKKLEMGCLWQILCITPPPPLPSPHRTQGEGEEDQGEWGWQKIYPDLV